jgi:hypothetical protein
LSSIFNQTKRQISLTFALYLNTLQHLEDEPKTGTTCSANHAIEPQN